MDALTAAFTSLADSVAAGAANLRANSLTLARHVGMRFSQIGNTLSGSCMLNAEEDAPEMSLPAEHKELLDALRRKHPKGFKQIAAIAKRFGEVDTKKQFEFLQTEAPAILGALALDGTSKVGSGKAYKVG